MRFCRATSEAQVMFRVSVRTSNHIVPRLEGGKKKGLYRQKWKVSLNGGICQIYTVIRTRMCGYRYACTFK